MSAANDASRRCDYCRAYGDHHTDRCPHDPNGYLQQSPERQQASWIYDQRVRTAGHDRTVHGRTVDGREIVRYDRAGKWFVESRYDGRKSTTLREAAKLAVAGTPLLDKPGGLQFDATVRKLTSKSSHS